MCNVTVFDIMIDLLMLSKGPRTNNRFWPSLNWLSNEANQNFSMSFAIRIKQDSFRVQIHQFFFRGILLFQYYQLFILRLIFITVLKRKYVISVLKFRFSYVLLQTFEWTDLSQSCIHRKHVTHYSQNNPKRNSWVVK